MDQGSGDSSKSAEAEKSAFSHPLLRKEVPILSQESQNEMVNSLQSNIEKLRFESASQDEKKDDGGVCEIGSQVDDESSSLSSEDSDIEPICSYPYGYIKRQTVYTCLTCNDPTQENWKPAGICIGCRYACHQGHDVISLETRRNFKCDCGNKKFPEGSCILCPDKDDTNEKNVYNNNNYKGTFCSCQCKEADCNVEDPLYQCVVCEDWYHASHCNAKVEGIEKNYTDLICGECTTKLDFLRYYDPFDSTAVVDEKAINEMMQYSELDLSDTENDGVDGKKQDTVCKLASLTMKDPYPTGQLWTLGWRGKLCRCNKCKEMYTNLNVSFLLDKDDETRRYFSEDDEEATQNKIYTLVRKFEEWLFQMEPQERTDMFKLEPNEVKEKMREYFSKTKNEEGEEFVFEDHLLDQLFDSFAEFILDVDGGADYLLDVDAFEKVFGQGGKSETTIGNNDGNNNEASSEELPSNLV